MESLKKTSVADYCRLCLVALGFVAQPAIAELELRGYVKSFVVAQDSISNELLDEPTTYQSQNSLRVMLEGFGDRTVWQIHYELSPVFSSRVPALTSQTFNVVSGSYRLTDLQTTLGDNDTDDKKQVFQNLDRLNVQFQFDAGDLTIGRQPIAFGSARVINPTDVFLPFDVRTFNTEYRTGVDAVRFQRPWGELGEIDVGIVLGEDANKENSAAFLQIRNNVRGADYHLALMEFSDQQLVGTGLETAVGDFGFWFEIANVSGDRSYNRASTGFDYAFGENVFAQIEYHYNGAGSNDSDDYLDLIGTTPFQRGGVFLLGKRYLMPAVTWQVTPLWFLSGQAIVNLSDNSSFISVSGEFNFAENFYMDLGYYHFTGDDLDVSPIGLPRIRSEYGLNPDTVYASIRYYF